MRKLTDKELRKLKEFRDILTDDIYKSKKTISGKFNVMMADKENKRELVCEGIEIFLTHSIEEIRKEREEKRPT